MAAKSSTVTVQILADNSQYKREMNETAGVTDKTTKDMGGSTEKLGSKMSTFAKVAVAAFAVAAISAVKDFVGDSIRAFSDLNESMNAVEVTFGENSDGIKQLGEEAAKSLGLSNAEFNGFAVQMSAFAHTIAGDGGDVVGVIDTLSTRVSDFASVMNLDVAEAARTFQSGLAGETEPLRKYGIQLDAASVQAHALATGIWDGNEAMTESEKVMGRHSLLMEQTEKVAGDFANTSEDLANAQRIAAAEMENAKARAGEALVPFAQLTTQLQLLAAETLGLVATGFAELTGKLTPAQAAVQKFEIMTGESADTLEALLTVNKNFGISIEDLSEAMTLAEGETASLTDSQKAFLIEIGYTQDEIDELSGLLADMSIEQSNAARDAGRHRGAIDNLGSGISDATEEVEEITTALERFEDEVRSQTDPMYALVEAVNDVAAAEQAVVAAAAEFTESSPEYRDAVLDLAASNDDLTAAQLKVAEQSGFTASTFRTHLESMGNLTKEQIDLIILEFDRVNAFQFATKSVRVHELIDQRPGGIVGGRAAGGPVGARTPYMVGERGPELFVPNSAGKIIPNGQMNGGGGGVVINLSVTSLDPQAAGRAVVEALQSWQRSNGAIPITTRSA